MISYLTIRQISLTHNESALKARLSSETLVSPLYIWNNVLFHVILLAEVFNLPRLSISLFTDFFTRFHEINRAIAGYHLSAQPVR